MLEMLNNFPNFANVQIFQNVAEVVNFHCCDSSHCLRIFKGGCTFLEKNWGHRENLGESGGQTFKGSDQKSGNFSTLATFNIRLLLVFGEESQ